MHKVLAIGELLWDLLPDGKLLGGAPANFTSRLKELGNDVIIISRVGRDDLGRQAVQILAKAGLDISFIQTDQTHPTGTVNVFFDKNKHPDYHINTKVAYDFIVLTDSVREKATQVNCIAFGTLAQRSQITRHTILTLIKLSGKALKFCDINLRKDCYTADSVTDSLQLADIVKLNHHELKALAQMFELNYTDDVLAAQGLVENFNLKICLVTYEHDGALAVSGHNEVIYSPGFKVDLEDSLGAGDAFSAAFVTNYLDKKPIFEALEAGNFQGALVARQKGAMQPLNRELFNQNSKKGLERVVNEQFAHLIHHQFK